MLTPISKSLIFKEKTSSSLYNNITYNKRGDIQRIIGKQTLPNYFQENANRNPG